MPASQMGNKYQRTVQPGPRLRPVWLKPVLLNQRRRSALGPLPLFSLKMWLLRSFPDLEKEAVLSAGQREGFEAP